MAQVAIHLELANFVIKDTTINIDHLFIQQKLQEKKVVKSVINCGWSIIG
jgi:hypothetical protein